MQANWSLILNVFLLIGVVVAIWRLMRSRNDTLSYRYRDVVSPPLADKKTSEESDDIIRVRKITPSLEQEESLDSSEPDTKTKTTDIKPDKAPQSHRPNTNSAQTVVLFISAAQDRYFGGYDLLQTLLAAGLKFGEGQLFHRHQNINGQGPILCSLAAATPTGVFDLQNIGMLQLRGLCLYMYVSNNSTVDKERFEIMLSTARQIAQDLDAKLLDMYKKTFTEQSLEQYANLLGVRFVETQLQVETSV